MAVKLHRCKGTWVKLSGHPCWRVEKALKDMGVDYERVTGPGKKEKRAAVIAGTGQNRFPAIQFENGTWYRAESNEMAQAIRDGTLMERAGGATAPTSG